MSFVSDSAAFTDDNPLWGLRQLGTQLACPAKSTFSLSGSPAHHVFLLEEGQIAETIVSQTGGEYWTALRRATWLLGACNVISGEPFACSFLMNRPGRVRVIPARDFLGLLETDTNLSRYVHKLHSREISEHLSKLATLALYDARHRLEEFLWQILPDLTVVNGRVRLPFSDIEITKIICCTPQYLSGIFKQLEANGLIRRVGGWLIVPDRGRLWHR
jgi:CRP-like cAMP-binding protein